MSLRHINAVEAKKLAEQGAALIDVREVNEYAREHVPGSRNYPLSRFAGTRIEDAPAVVFFCQSGGRTHMSAMALARSTNAQAYVIDGGIMAWKAAGLPVSRGM